MSQQAKASQQLQHAFDQFSELSEQLQDSYQVLQDRVSSLTRELYAVRSERLKQLTEKEQLAERLGVLLNALPGGVVVIDAQGVICETNPAAEKIFRQSLINRRWQEVMPQGLSVSQDGNDLVLDDNRVITVSSQPLETNGGYILLLQDVTETRALQAQVNRQQRLSEMGEMTARLAHQLRTPLATALLYASHLDKPQTSPQQHRESVTQLLSGLYHLDQMINDMLVFSRGGNSGEESISLPELLEQVRISLLPQLQAADAQWQVSGAGCAAFLYGNPVALFGALSNLAVNALHACGKGAQLGWRISRHASTIKISLQDNGPGIPETLGEQIFEPFFTTRNSGTGLGLAVVRSVIEAHGGSVRLATSKQAGACFVIELPARVRQQMPSHLQSCEINTRQSERRTA